MRWGQPRQWGSSSPWGTLKVSIDQVEPLGTSAGSFDLTGTVLSGDPVISLVMTLNGGDPVALVLQGDGTYETRVTDLISGLNTIVVTATDFDDTDSASVVVANQPDEAREVVLLSAVRDVIERVPWHLRAQRPSS